MYTVPNKKEKHKVNNTYCIFATVNVYITSFFQNKALYLCTPVRTRICYANRRNIFNNITYNCSITSYNANEIQLLQQRNNIYQSSYRQQVSIINQSAGRKTL